MQVLLHHKDGELISVSSLDDALNPNFEVFAPIEHEEQEIIGEMAAKEKVLREAREKLDLTADDVDLQNLLNPPAKKPKKDDDADPDSDSEEDADASGDDEDGGDEDDDLEDM